MYSAGNHKCTTSPRFSKATLISDEQTHGVMGLFSGYYLVLCGNEIASHLYHRPQTLDNP